MEYILDYLFYASAVIIVVLPVSFVKESKTTQTKTRRLRKVYQKKTKISQISNRNMNLIILNSNLMSKIQWFLIILNIKMNILINNTCNFRITHQFTFSNQSSTHLNLQVSSINNLIIMNIQKANQTFSIKILLIMLVFLLIINFRTINKITKTDMEDKLCQLMFKLLLLDTNTV